MAEWLERCPERPPGRVVGQVATEIKRMLDEGIAADRVRRGLAEWQRKGLHASTLPSVVHEMSQLTLATDHRVPNEPLEAPPDGLEDHELAAWYARRRA
jgi:hypothetical protein